MQVLENAVRKLKAPAVDAAHGDETHGRAELAPHAENPPMRREPVFHSRRVPEPPAETWRDEGLTARDDGPPSRVFVPPVQTAPPPPPTAEPHPAPATAEGRPLFSEPPEESARKGGGGGDGSPPEDGQSERRSFGPVATWLGAAAAIALVAGASLWTYRLGQREAMDIPIVAALEGPSGIEPVDQGGRVIANQGLSVNAVMEGGGARDVAAIVTTAPGEAGVLSGDQTQAELEAMVRARKPIARPENAPSGVLGVTEEAPHFATFRVEEGVPAAVPNGEIDAAAIPVASEAPQQDPTTDDAPGVLVIADIPASDLPAAIATATPEAGAVATADPAEEVEAAPVQVASLGPIPPADFGSAFAPALQSAARARPANLNLAVQNAVDAAVQSVFASPQEAPVAEVVEVAAVTAVAATNNLDVIPLPSGTKMIQIGAYDSEAVARQQWDRFSRLHSDLLGSKTHYVQRTNNSGKIFYRLRVAGYDSKEQTRAACAALSARGLPCITAAVK